MRRPHRVGRFTRTWFALGLLCLSSLWSLPSVAAVQASKLGVGPNSGCFVTESGGVACWGYNDNGLLGDGTTTHRSAPVPVTGLNTGVAAVATGGTHACALTIGGGVKCWGANTYGQLGDGTFSTNRLAPVDVVGLGSGVLEIFAGSTFTCALTIDGALKCWGHNYAGQLGDGTTTNRSTPFDVSGLDSGVLAAAAGQAHACAVTLDGATKCWGSNIQGQLGDTTTTGRQTPVAVAGLGAGVAAVTAGGAHTCALLADGAVKCWGLNNSGQLGDGSTTNRLAPVDATGLGSGVAMVDAGDFHSCALTVEGAAKCWGRNVEGQLGNGSFEPNRLVPVDVSGLDSGVAAVDAGAWHTCALSDGGQVKCWGRNTFGQLGDGTGLGRSSPVFVLGETDLSAMMLSEGALSPAFSSETTSYTAHVPHAVTSFRVWPVVGASTATVTVNGDPVTSGHASAPIALNVGDNTITTVVTAGDGITTRAYTITMTRQALGVAVQAIRAGNAHTCALTGAGGVKCWGSNGYGQLGDGTYMARQLPVDVYGLDAGVAALATGLLHSCAVTVDGAVKCWGHNNRGQLGDGTTIDRLTPVDVSGLSTGVVAVSAGDQHTCALTVDGAVKCWGFNGAGALGDGTLTNSSTPVAVSGLSSGVAALSVGLTHSCALTVDGGLKCWGSNFNGRLGDGTTTSRPSPVAVFGLASGVVALSAGESHTCAVTTFGGLKCWGVGLSGQLGRGGTSDAWVPGDVQGLTFGADAVAAGGQHSCARMAAGGMKCWGANTWGQVGDGTTVNRTTPANVSGLSSGVAAMDAGSSHTCVLTDGGQVQCWGANFAGQLGDGTSTSRSIPTGVLGLVSSNADLSALSLSNGALSPAFSSATTSYTAVVSNATTSITLTPTLGDATATVTIDGTAVASGSASDPIALGIGSNPIAIEVTAQDGTTRKTYTVTAKRAPAPPVIATPAANSITNQSRPLFAGTAEPNSAVTVRVDSTYTGTASVDGAGNWTLDSWPHALGDGVHGVDASATLDGDNSSDYSGITYFTVDATAPAAPVVMSPADGAVTSGTPTYSGTAEPNSTVEVIVDSASVGTTTADGSGAWALTQPTALAEGAHTVKAKATDVAGNVSADSATINFTRASQDAALSALSLSSGTLSPVFAAGTSNYTASVGNGTASITVTPIAAGVGASITINGTAVVSGTASAALALDPGTNTITVAVTAQDGTTVRHYSVALKRNRVPVFSGVPAISGTGLTGRTLTAANTGASDADGDPVTLGYQWKADGFDMAGATDSSYTVAAADRGKAITLVVTADDGSDSAVATTDPVVIGNTAPAFTATPVITGIARVGNTLAATGMEAADGDGDPVTLGYQWLRNGDSIAGATEATYAVQLVDRGAAIGLVVTASDGIDQTSATAASVSVARSTGLLAREDRFALRENSGAMLLDVLANDDIADADLAGGQLTITSAPENGTASVNHGALADDASDDRILYSPNPSFSGPDVLAYRLCDVEGECVQATVDIMVRPWSIIELEVDTETGFRLFPGGGLRALPSARFVTTDLVAPVTGEWNVPGDPSHGSPWDADRAGTMHRSYRIAPPVDAQPASWRILVEAHSVTGAELDLIVGADRNGDGLPSLDEVACVAAMSRVQERCEVALTHPGAGEIGYWVMVHNRSETEQTTRVNVFAVPMGEGGGSLTVTGPGHLEAGEAFEARLAWSDPSLLPGEMRAGYLSVQADPSSPIEPVPVLIRRTGSDNPAVWLQDGQPRTMRLAAHGLHDRMVFDVPAAASSLEVTLQNAEGVALYLTHVATPADHAIEAAPYLTQAQFVLPAEGADKSLLLSGQQLRPGRWYVTPVNTLAAATERFELQVRTLARNEMPTPTPGHYFNPDRSGHGLFLDHAGENWVLTWFTYLEDGTPTWYISLPQPRSAISWSAPLVRVSWNGSATHQAVVGHVTVNGLDASAGSPERLSFAYTVDGRSGGEVLARLGGPGCVSQAGVTLDVNGHWYSPARPGFGYQVQFDAATAQEGAVAYLYDEQGFPRWLYGQQSLDLSRPDMALLQLDGFCPTCARREPQMREVGFLTRSYTNGTISHLSAEAILLPPLRGAWSQAFPVARLTDSQQCR